MKTSRIWTALVCCGIALMMNAQVINSINDQNMRKGFEKQQQAEQAEKLRQQRPQRTKLDPNVTIDTTTVYFALVDSAQHCINSQNWGGAEAFILRAIASEPHNENNSLLLSNLGTLQRYQGKFAEALKNYSMALDLTPNAVTLLHNRAALLVTLDSLPRAQRDYERIMQLDPADTEARYDHGMVAFEMGEVTTARDDFEWLLRLDPMSWQGHHGMAMLHKAVGDYEKAVSHLSDAIKVAPSAALLGHRADCYLMRRRLADASEDIAQALQLDAEDPFLYVLRAKLNKLRYNFEDVKRDMELAEKYGISKSVVKQLLEGE